jgi:predicted nucleotidyltransferase
MLERMLSSKSKVKILRMLLSSPEREFCMDDITRGTKMSWGTVHPSMKSLVSSRIVTIRKAGRTKLYSINERNLLCRSLSDAFKSEKEVPVRIAKEFASKLDKRGIKSITLFGSVARNEATEKSDIDLLFITKDAEAAKKRVGLLAREFTDKYDIDVAPIYMTQAEFDRRKKKFDRFIMNVIQEGMVLFGSAGG